MIRGLVLEGGGAKGAYQIGAYKALKELGYKFDYVVGTSIGAINGAIISQGDEELAEELWRNISYSTLINGGDSLANTFLHEDLNIYNIFERATALKELVSFGGLDTTPLKELLIHYIDEEKIRSSEIKFGLVTLDITNRKPVEIFVDDMEEGSLTNYIYGSSNLLVFKQEPIDGRYLIDGGYYENNPVYMLEDKCDQIINIILFPRKNLPKFNEKIDYKYIMPSDRLPDILNFSKDKANFGLELGYFDTYKYFKNLLGERYYVKDPSLETAIIIFTKLYEYVKKQYPYIINRRYYFEKWLPKYFNKKSISIREDYNQALVMLLEKIAWKLKIERFKIYELKEFSMEIFNHPDFTTNFDIKFEREIIKIIEKVLD